MIDGRVRRRILTGLAPALVVSALVLASAVQGDSYGEYDEGLVVGTVAQRPLEPQEGRLMRNAGIGSVRFWVPWATVEAVRGTYRWTDADADVRDIAATGLTPVPFLFGTPPWAAERDGYECEDDGCLSYAPASLETRYAFARFARAAVHRYGPGGQFWQNNPALPYRPIHVWQLWNEPNLQSFWLPAVSATGYAELVRLAGNEIHAEDPGADVLLAGLSGKVSTSRRWSTQSFLRRFYVFPRIGESFDGVALHPYDGHARGVFRQIRLAHQILAVRDPGVDLWITEIGWASRGNSNKWNLVKTLRGQASLLRRVFGRLIRHADRWDVRGIYWYAWRDTEPGESVCGWCGAAGLRDRDGDPKPAYHELRRLTAGLD